jgi:hypothetical protein
MIWKPIEANSNGVMCARQLGGVRLDFVAIHLSGAFCRTSNVKNRKPDPSLTRPNTSNIKKRKPDPSLTS